MRVILFFHHQSNRCLFISKTLSPFEIICFSYMTDMSNFDLNKLRILKIFSLVFSLHHLWLCVHFSNTFPFTHFHKMSFFLLFLPALSNCGSIFSSFKSFSFVLLYEPPSRLQWANFVITGFLSSLSESLVSFIVIRDKSSEQSCSKFHLSFFSRKF